MGQVGQYHGKAPLSTKTEVKRHAVGSESTGILQASMNSSRKHEMRIVCTHFALNVSEEHNYVPPKSVHLRWVRLANTLENVTFGHKDRGEAACCWLEID